MILGSSFIIFIHHLHSSFTFIMFTHHIHSSYSFIIFIHHISLSQPFIVFIHHQFIIQSSSIHHSSFIIHHSFFTHQLFFKRGVLLPVLDGGVRRAAPIAAAIILGPTSGRDSLPHCCAGSSPPRPWRPSSWAPLPFCCAWIPPSHRRLRHARAAVIVAALIWRR